MIVSIMINLTAAMLPKPLAAPPNLVMTETGHATIRNQAASLEPFGILNFVREAVEHPARSADDENTFTQIFAR